MSQIKKYFYTCVLFLISATLTFYIAYQFGKLIGKTIAYILFGI